MNPLSDFKTEIKLFLIVLIVAVVIAVSAVWFLQSVYAPIHISEQETGNSEQLTTNKQQSAIDTSDWQTYRNDEYGFEVKYPEDFAITQNDGLALVSFCGGEYSESCGIHGTGNHSEIYLFGLQKDGSSSALYSTVFEGWDVGGGISWPGISSDCDVSPIKVSGEEGKLWRCRGVGMYAFWEKPGTNLFYVMTVSSLDAFPNQRDTFDQILSTFRFVDSPETSFSACDNISSSSSKYLCRMNEAEQNTPYPPEQAEAIIKDRATEVMLALKNKDMVKLASFVHPDKPLSFWSINAYFELPKEKIPSFFEDQTEHTGSYDGSGFSFTYTQAEYYESYIYDRDYLNAPDVSYDLQFMSSPTTGGGQFGRYGEEDPISVTYAFPQSSPNAAFDWRNLRLWFTEENGVWYLREIMQNQWAI